MKETYLIGGKAELSHTFHGSKLSHISESIETKSTSFLRTMFPHYPLIITIRKTSI